MAQSILYYPTIDIHDGNWLRNAVLYWDSVSSIVPFEEYDVFSPELNYLKDNGVYFPSNPKDLFQSSYADAFSRTFIKRLDYYTNKKHGNNTFNMTNNQKIESMPQSNVMIHKRKIHAPIFQELIHALKIPPSLYETLSGNQFISDYGYDGWMEIDRRIATIYMRTLAEYTVKASVRDMVIGSDKQNTRQELFYRSFPRLNQPCYSLELKNCFPQPAMDVGYEDILLFKAKRGQELLHFRMQLRELEKALSTCQSVEEIKFTENAFRERWESAVKDLQKAYKDSRIHCVWGSLSSLISTSAVPELFEKFINSSLSPLTTSVMLGGAGLINVGCKFLSYKNKIHDINSDSGFLYILQGQKEGIIGLR